MRTVWAMVCGTVRDQVDFSMIMDFLLKSRQKGIIQGIVVTTWKDEFANLKSLREKLVENDVAIVESEQNDHLVAGMRSGSVNYWRQAKQMQAALDVIPAEAIVLKTRTDRALPSTRKLVAMLDEPDPLPRVADKVQQWNLPNFPQVFEHQIAIFKARTGRILQFSDFAFMGYSADVRKLINFDIAEFSFTRGLVANIQFFIYPFIRQYPIIRDYYRVVDFYPLLTDLKDYTQTGGTKFPGFLERLYAVYFGILAIHFRISSFQPEGFFEDAELPIEFSDLFHSGHKKLLVHDALGVTFNSQLILDEFLKQSIEEKNVTQKGLFHRWGKRNDEPTSESVVVHERSTKNVLAILKSKHTDIFDRITNTELAELKSFSQNKDFSPNHWLRTNTSTLAEQDISYKTSLRFELPGISDEQRQAIWQECESDLSASSVLFKFWISHDVAPKYSAPYLMSSARTNNRFSILTGTRLLQAGYLNEGETSEILRINNFFAGFHVHHHEMNAEIACYILARYMYLNEHKMNISRATIAQAEYVFERFLPGKFDEFNQLVSEPQKLMTFWNNQVEQQTKDFARQRVLELALETTHRQEYWQQLEPMISHQPKFYNYLASYRYGVKWQLL